MIINNPIVLDLREKPDFTTVIFAVHKEAVKDYFGDINTVQVTKVIKEMKLDDKVIILAKCKKYSLVSDDKEFFAIISYDQNDSLTINSYRVISISEYV